MDMVNGSWVRVHLVLGSVGIGIALAALLLPGRNAWPIGDEKKSPNPLSGNAEAIAEGMHLFRTGFCGNCHGMNANGGGRGAPNAANLQKYKRGYTEFVKTVKEGYKTMPAWGGGPELPDEAINKIGAWLETLAKPEANWKDPQ
jgi:mono/diheme cytochrome c family protein